jgi:acyl-coenzyme A synthetase/AMP-(fatty) acid ligase
MNDFDEIIGRLLTGPAHPGKDFTASGRTYEEVYAIAAGFLEEFTSPAMKGEPVCICTDDKGIIAAAMLASVAGGPVCILPYSLSPQALTEIRQVMKFRHAIVDAQVELPEGVRAVRAEQRPWVPDTIARARDLNAVFLQLFTGGSTGKPKVWSKTPVNMFAEAHYQAAKYGIGPGDLIVSTVPPYHIYGLLFTVLAPLLASATVLPGMYTFPYEIVAALQNSRATVLVSVPVHYRVLKGAVMETPALRLAFSSAGPLDPEDAAAFYRQTGIGPEEIYGSTETGGIACRNSATGRLDQEPFDCIRWNISDGRLCVNSPFISPELPVDGDGFYMTGDRAAAVTENRFTLLGRADGVVKVGGKRVDLYDVEDKIKRIPGVRGALLFSLSGKRGRDADIAAAIETDIGETELRRALYGALEQYAVPRRIRILDRMPSTAAGKYDRDAIMKLFDTDTE